MTTEELEQAQAKDAVAAARYGTALNDVKEQVAILAVRRAELGFGAEALDDCELRAPFEAVVAERHVAPGAYLQVGENVVSLVRVDPLRFRGGVPEREAAQVREKQEAEIRVEGHRDPIRAKVSRISPSLDPASRSLVVEIDVPNPGFALRVGLFAESEIIVDSAGQVLAIPAAAVREFAGIEKVWLVRNGEAAEQVVETGRRREGLIEILEGLKPGDRIVADAATGRRGPVAEEDQNASKDQARTVTAQVPAP